MKLGRAFSRKKTSTRSPARLNGLTLPSDLPAKTLLQTQIQIFDLMDQHRSAQFEIEFCSERGPESTQSAFLPLSSHSQPRHSSRAPLIDVREAVPAASDGVGRQWPRSAWASRGSEPNPANNPVRKASWLEERGAAQGPAYPAHQGLRRRLL